jgi:hypothetical protein
VSVTLKAEHEHLPPRAGRERFLLQLDALPLGDAPRHLVLLVDRSSSMTGHRLEDAKRVVDGLLVALPDGTEVSLVAFDETVDVRAESVVLDGPSRAELRRVTKGLTPGYGTDTGGALLRGFGLAQRHGPPATHLLLLSDGYPSRGLIAPSTLGDLVRHSRVAATLSTVGLGLGADTYLMMSLARQGGGAFQHVPDGTSVVHALGAELGQLAALRANRVEVRFRLRAGVRLSVGELSGPRFAREGDDVVLLPRLVAGEPLRSTFEVVWEDEVAPGGPGHLSLGVLQLEVTDLSGQLDRRELSLGVEVQEGAPGPRDLRVLGLGLKRRLAKLLRAALEADRADERALLMDVKAEARRIRTLARQQGVAEQELEEGFALLEGWMGEPLPAADLSESLLTGVGALARPDRESTVVRRTGTRSLIESLLPDPRAPGADPPPSET